MMPPQVNECDLQGRLSLVQISDEQAIITSEGGDQGYLINETNLESEQLGIHLPDDADATEFVPPPMPTFFANDEPIVVGGLESVVNMASELTADYYFFAVSFSDIKDFLAKSSLESPALFGKTRVRVPRLTVRPDTPENASERDVENFFDRFITLDNQRSFLAERKVRALIQNIHVPNDSRVKYMNIYRSIASDGDSEPESLNYYRIDQMEVKPNSYLSYIVSDNSIDFGTDWKLADKVNDILPFAGELDSALTYRDNSLMPADITQLSRFNDRLFAPHGSELRFSDVRNAVPFWHAWPVLNSIRTGQRIDFAAAYRGLLLFGASDNLYRLSGTSPANFQYDQISSRGPVSPHAWGVLNNAFGFVGTDGLYMSDGTEAPEIAPQLKGYFNRYEVEDGFVGMLPNKASLWGVNRRNKSTGDTDHIYFVNDGNDWVRVAEGSSDRTGSAIGIPNASHIRQYASAKFDGLPLTGVIADGQRAPRLIDWIVDDETTDGLTKYTGQDFPPTEEIAWSWESQELDWNVHRLGEEMKIFTELVISGTAENDVTVTFYIDDREPFTKTVKLNRTAQDTFYPVRIRITRRGYGCRFKLEGTGAVTLRGLQLNGWV